MNVLHICANPRPIEESASKQLAAAFFSKLVERNPDVTVNNVDLYQEPPPFLSYDAYNRFWKPVQQPGYTPNKREESAASYALAQGEMFCQADVLVLTMPLWAGGPPAIMKAWLDQVASPGIAYDVSPEGPKPKHQLRKVILLVASGDVYKEGDPRDGITPIVNNTFGFIGVTDIEVAWADGQDATLFTDSAERKQTAMEAAEELAEDLAGEP